MSTKKLYMALSIVFLVIGIVAPSAMLIYNQNLNSSGVVVSNPNGMSTGGNTTLISGPTPVEGIRNTVIVAVTAVFIALFVGMAFLWLRKTYKSCWTAADSYTHSAGEFTQSLN